MLDVIVLCEGQTEREFCRSLISPFLFAAGISLAGTLVGKPGRKRGGIQEWETYRSEVLRLAKERDRRHVCVMVDYYSMPSSWPGRERANTKRIATRGRIVEESLVADLSAEIGARFHPCVQLHEFESLLFVDPKRTAMSIATGGGLGSHDHVRLGAQLAAIRSGCGPSVEHIDDSPATAPSKRLLSVIPGYDKVAWGVTAASDIGVAALRGGCPWLDRWLTRLETSAGSTNG